jgi:hypothetical protein
MARLVSEHFRHDGKPKTGYETREAAEAERKRSQKGAAYQCKFCQKWHVGGQGKEELKKVAKRSVTKK